MYVWEKYQWSPKKSTQFPGRELQPVVSCPVGAGNQNLGALQKQSVLFLNSEPSLQPLITSVYFYVRAETLITARVQKLRDN